MSISHPRMTLRTRRYTTARAAARRAPWHAVSPWVADLALAALQPTPITEPAARIAPLALQEDRQDAPQVRMSVDPRDGRRAVISGRMSEVCDALDRLVLQQTLSLA